MTGADKEFAEEKEAFPDGGKVSNLVSTEWFGILNDTKA